MALNIDDLSMKIGEILGNLDSVFKELDDLQGVTRKLETGSDTRDFRLVQLEQSQKSILEIKANLETLVKGAGSIDVKFDLLHSEIDKLNSNLLALKEAIKNCTSQEVLNHIDSILATTKTIQEELTKVPSIRQLLLASSLDFDEHGNPLTWAGKIRKSIEYNFTVELGRAILIVVGILVFNLFTKYIYPGQTQQQNTVDAEQNKRMDAIQKKLDEEQKSVEEISNGVKKLLEKKNGK